MQNPWCDIQDLSVIWIQTTFQVFSKINSYTTLAIQFRSLQSLSPVRLFSTPWTAALQASLLITNFRSLPKLKSVMPSNHLIFCCPLLLLPSVFPSIRVFSKQSVLCIRWPKYYTVRPFMYDHLHLLIVNSQSISPPLLSSLAITSLFSMSVSLFLFHR